MERRQPSLLFCILMDLIGMSTYAIPLVGEVADFIWAPLSAIIFFITFGGWKGAMGGVGNFFEELLPGTDFIPTFTLMWLSQRKSRSEENSRPVVKGRLAR